MQITAQSYPIPKAGGTFWFRLLSDLGMPLTLTSVSCTNSTINSSITYDKPNYVFRATFPANSSTTNKNYNFTVNYSVNSVAHTDTFTVRQTGTSSYLYTEADVVPRPFVLSYTADFFSSEDPTNYDSVTTFLAEDASYTAPHYISISEYLTAAQNGELTDGQWVYVDCKINLSASTSYTSSTYSLSTRWIETDATPASTVYPYIYIGRLQNTGGTKFNSKPSDEVLATYRTVGFKHKQSNIMTTASTGQYYVNYNDSTNRAFVQATTTSWWTNTTCYSNSGNISVTVPYILYYNWPVSNPTYTSLGNNEYRLSRTYSSAQTTPRGIVLSVNPEGNYTGEKVFLQVPSNSVNISNTSFNVRETTGQAVVNIGTFSNFDFSSDLFSFSFPNGQPDWITSASVTNPSGSTLRADINVLGNYTGSARTTTARVNWLDQYTNVTITQSASSDVASLNITNDSRTLNYDETTAYYWIATELVSNVTVSFSGDVDIDRYTLTASTGGYQLFVYTNNNTSTSMKTTTITASGTYDGVTFSDTALLYKKGAPGSITLSPSQVTVSKSSGTATSTITASGIVTSLTATYWGDGGVTTVTSATISNNTLTVVYGANNTGNTITNYAKVSGEDQYGDEWFATLVMTQLPDDPSITVSPAIQNVANTPSSTTFTVTGYEVSNITASTSESWITDCQLSGSTLTVTYDGNSSYLPRIGDVTLTGTSSVGTTVTATASVSQRAVSGSISVNPSSYVSDGAADTATFTISSYGVNNIQPVIGASSITFTSLTISGNTLTAVMPANTGNTTLGATVAVRGTDGNGSTAQALIRFEQRPVPTITFGTASRTLNPTETTAYYPIRVYNVESPTVSFSGTVSVDHYTFTQDQSDPTLYALYVYTNNNTGSSQQSSTITVSGSSALGTSATGTGTLIKKGTGGSITVSPTSTRVGKSAGTVTFNVTMTDIVSHTESSSGNITFSNISISNGVLSASYPVNNSGENRTGYLNIVGTDGNGDTVYSPTITVVQLGQDPSITFNTASRTLNATEVTAYYPVRVYDVASPSVSFSGNVGIDHYTFTQDANDSTLYALYVYTDDNTGTTQQSTTITVTGTSSLGTTVTGTGTLIKLGVSGTITLNPNSVSVTEVAGTATSTITTSGITSSLTTEYWGDGGVTTVTNASISGSTLTVTYGANNTGSTVTNYVKVSGTDNNGNTQFATFVITQTGINPAITVTPSSKTVASTDVYTTYTITSTDVSNLMMNTTALWITDYQINNGTLSVTFGTNSTSSQRSATLTVSGTTSLGTTVSDSVTLIQEAPQGEAGSITVNPDSRTLNPTETTCMYVVTYENITSALSVSVTGNVNITDYHLSEEDFGYYLWVTTADNTGTSDLTSTFTISGTDELGITRTATATLLKKAPAAGSITVEPWQKTVGYQAGSTTFTVTARNIVGNLTTEVISTTTMSITSHTISNGTLTVVYGANTGAQKNAAISISGTDTDGDRQWVIARLYQDQAPATYTFAFNPAGQSSKSISSSPTSVRYTIDSYKTIGSSYELGYDITNIEYTNGSWPTIINVRYEDGKPYILVPMNLTGSQRRAVIHFVQDESGREITSTLTQTSGGASTETFLPIWRDDVYTASANDFIEYHITLGGDIIYAGKAYKYPEASNIEWTINDTCSNYIGTGITFTNGIQRIPDYCKTFTVATNQSTIKASRFYNSWAYEDTDYWLSDPIDYRVDPRQWLPVSFLSSNSRNITVGSTSYTASASDDGWTVMTNLNNLTLNCGGTFTVTPGVGRPRNYRVDCGDFALYYANAFGGWDALLVKGTTKKTDNIEHMNYRRKSRDLSEFSKVNYQNNITPTWSLNTGITVNGQKMYHLLESTMVYLHNLETNEIIPVVITNAQCEYLDYTNNGKKPYYYNITVEESNLKLRK